MNLMATLAALPLADIQAALLDPTSLGKQSKVAEDMIVAAMPGIDGMLLSMLVELFVYVVYANGGGTIAPGSYQDAQTTQSRGGRNA